MRPRPAGEPCENLATSLAFMTQRVPFIRPTMPDANQLAADFESISAANWYTNFGPQERALRSGIAGFIGGSPEVVTVSNATVGLMTALAALLPRGDGADSIATASFTFSAGAQATAWHGYRPSWIDIDPVTLQPSLDSFRRLADADGAIKAILLTNSFGIGNTEIAEWEAAAEALNIPLIIDSAPGFGSKYAMDEYLGMRGVCEVFSFHATKPFAIGEGGAIVTRDEELALRLREMTNFGFRGKPSEAVSLGMNAKLQEINAAIGLWQLSRFEQVLHERQELLRRYEASFAGTPYGLVVGATESSGGFAPVVVDAAVDREHVLRVLDARGIDARSYYSPPVHRHEFFVPFAPIESLANTDDLSARVISLPVLPDMSDAEFERVIAALEAATTSMP